jgi:hypothetical protein
LAFFILSGLANNHPESGFNADRKYSFPSSGLGMSTFDLLTVQFFSVIPAKTGIQCFIRDAAFAEMTGS